MPIKKMKFRNFQSHKTTTLILIGEDGNPVRLVAIHGSTDSGKSAFMRGVRYVYLLGKPWIRCGEDEMEVLVAHTDYSLKRHTEFSATGRNLDDYIQMSGEKDPWRKFQKQIPDGLTKKTHIFNLDIEDVNENISLNFIGQFDRILPLALKPSKISKLFGSMSGRNAVDSALKETNAQIRNLKQEISSAEAELDNKKVEIEHIKATIPDDEMCCEDLLNEHERLSRVIIKQKKLTRISSDVILIDDKLAKLKMLLSELDLTTIVDEINTLGTIIEIANRIPEIPDINTDELRMTSDGLNDIEKDVEAIGVLEDLDESIEDIELSLIDTDHKLHEKQDELEQARYDLYLFLHENDMCPYSGCELPEKCAKKLSCGSATILGAETEKET